MMACRNYSAQVPVPFFTTHSIEMIFSNTSTATVMSELIRPPAPILATIEKTVLYVKRNGPSFEEKLKLNDKENKFSFLDEKSPYHKYYRAQFIEEKNGSESKNGEQKPTIEKPDELFFATDLPPVSTHDLEVIKAVALYVACNSDKHGEVFQRQMDRAGRRNQFAFMNKNHTLWRLFQKYIKQYREIIEKSNNKSSTHIDRYHNLGKSELFSRAYNRASYERSHKQAQKDRFAEERSKQLHYASIDWQDFTLVAKVNFDAVDEVSELAVPLLKEDVMYRSLQSKSKELELEVSAARKPSELGVHGETGDKVENVPAGPEVARAEESAQEVARPRAPPKGMKIRAAGESRLKRKANEAERNIQCPITGKQIPELQFDTHLKVLLRDSRYQEQKDNFMRKNFTFSSNLTTDQVYENIKRLVNKRGASDEEMEARKRIDLHD